MKEKILLVNNQTYEFDDVSIYKNLFTITFDENVDMSSLLEDMSIFDSIQILTRGDVVCAKYDGYNTVYKQDDHRVTFSNDKSVYEEPHPTPDPEPLPEPEPEPEPELTLEEVKKEKIAQLSSTCEQCIYNGVTMEIDGETKYFSYKAEDQVNLGNALQLAQVTGLDVPYHADGDNCKLYTPEQIVKLYVQQMTNLTHNQTYFNQLRMYVETLEEKEDVENIMYGQDLTGKYLDKYTEMMTQAGVLIKAYLGLDKADDPATDVTPDTENGTVEGTTEEVTADGNN